MVKAYLVNHTHWDREWYFTTQDAQVLSDQLFTQVLDELESHPEANFTLDGQMSIIDEYVEIHPEAKERIHDLVERGQLFIGPWYTQTDANI
ncbi:MAG: alpha-mannosidase, partial [Lactobacillus iners]|nr:alpha-mannosidase [Lactobacillus iners]